MFKVFVWSLGIIWLAPPHLQILFFSFYICGVFPVSQDTYEACRSLYLHNRTNYHIPSDVNTICLHKMSIVKGCFDLWVSPLI